MTFRHRWALWGARAGSFCALSLALAAAPESARAAGGPEVNQRALKLAYEGDDLYARSRWAEAFERFEAADALAHSPVFVLYMARCRKNGRRLLEASALYDKVAHEPMGADAPRPFREAIQSAVAERAEVERLIPHARVVVNGAAHAAIRVDGKDVADASRMAIDPGVHTFEASGEGRTDRREVTLLDGADVAVTLSLEPHREQAVESPSPSAAPLVVALGVSVAGLAVGGVTGAMAMNKASPVKPNCIDSHCLTSDKSALDSARSLATVSTIGFVVGGVGLATAGVLFFLRTGKKSAVTATVGPSQVTLGATF